MPSSTASASKKAPSVGGLVVIKASKPRSINHVYDQTRLLFSTLVILSQDVKMPVEGGALEGKTWVTLLPVFVYMEAFLAAVMYPGMHVDLLLLIRDDSFRHIRKLVNDPSCKRSLDSVLLEVSGRFEEILLGYSEKSAYPGSGVGKTSANEGIFAVFEESGNDTSNDGSSFPSHGEGELRTQVATLETQLASRNKAINCLREEKAALAKENASLLKENDELRRRVPSLGTGSKHGRDDSRGRSQSRGRSHSREPSSGNGGSYGSKQRSFQKKVNYGSDR